MRSSFIRKNWRLKMKKFIVVLGCLFLATLVSTFAQTNAPSSAPQSKPATWSITPAVSATCLAEYEKKIEEIKKEFKYIPIEDWKGVKFVFYPVSKFLQKEGYEYRDFIGGKGKAGHPAYEEAVGRIGTVTDVAITKEPEIKYDISLTMDDNGQVYKTTIYDPKDESSSKKRTRCSGISPIADVEKARELWKGKTFWSKLDISKYPEETLWKTRLGIPFKLVDVEPGQCGVRLIFETETGEKGYLDCSLSGTNTNISWYLDKLIFLEDPQKLYPYEEKIWKAIKEGKFLIGMTPEQVKVGWGKPEKIRHVTTAKGTEEIWEYEENKAITFENGLVVKIEE